ncbi:MAG: hypothetical protein NTV94_14890 [Planctomycetota bacterium]|nr:hypothetical protein [Planctomycetota bacterium]
MATHTQTNLIPTMTTTSYGGENIMGFRITKSWAAQNTTAPTKQSPALARANAWLLDNNAKVAAHAKASTKCLIGRDAV